MSGSYEFPIPDEKSGQRAFSPALKRFWKRKFQQILGSISPASISTIRVLPSGVLSRTRP